MWLNVIFRYPTRLLGRLFSLVVRKLLGTITHVTTEEPILALTFDDGPDPDYTPRLLDILKAHRARATFFMTGEAARRHPEIVKRVAEGGHTIGNHSFDHPSFPLISGRERRAQMRACAKAVAPYGVRLFRPPYGQQNLFSRFDAFLLGYEVVAWNVSTDDWCSRDALLIAKQAEQKIRPGSIIVFHDRLSDALEKALFDRESLLEAVDILLQRLQGRFAFVTVPDLLRRGKPQKKIWYKEANIEWLNNLQKETGPGMRYAKRPRASRIASLLHGWANLG